MLTSGSGLQVAGEAAAAGNSSFGMSGVNAHVLLWQAAGPAVPAAAVQVQSMVTVSGHRVLKSCCRLLGDKRLMQLIAERCVL